VVLVLIVLAISFFLPVQRRTHCGSNRVRCASNLRQIGQAILLYSNDNHGAYPRTRATAQWRSPHGSATAAKPVPVYGTGIPATQPWDKDGPAENDVTAALFMLLRTQDITSDVFTCPSADQEKDDFAGLTADKRSNFTDWRKNLSYSYQNPYPSADAIKRGFKLDNSVGAEFAVAADMNPGTAGKEQNVLAVTTNSSARQVRQANSMNHDRDGQNILYGDGHVAWESNPFVGVNRDNIYTRSRDDGSGNDPKVNHSDLNDPFGSPYDANDSVLLPTDD
jgi:prepilin-type processing-associated H-X9-DG protein